VKKSKKNKAEKKPKGKNLLNDLIKKFGDQVWSFENNKSSYPEIQVIPSSSVSINWALGRGGLPRGRLTEVFGPESSGKTTLSYDFIREVQRAGGTVALVDVENSFDTDYLHQCGIDEKQPGFIFAQPDWAEQALEIVRELILSEKVDLIVLDSIAALIPKAELEADVSDMQIGLQARIVTKFCKMLNTDLKGTKTAVLVINQVRDKIGGFGWGPQISTPGGRMLRHTASVRIELKRAQTLKGGSKQVGFLSKIKVIKNKVGPPFREVFVPILYSFGLDSRLDLINLALEAKIIKKRASIFYIKNSALGNGWREAHKTITKKKKVYDLVLSRIQEMLDKKSDLGSDDDTTQDKSE